MKTGVEDVAREIEGHFAAERTRLKAPNTLWSRIDAKLENRAAHEHMHARRRWRALAATVVAAAIIGMGLFALIDKLGGGGQRSGNEVWAAAMEALFDPDLVGLHSYDGIAEYTVNEAEVGSETDGPPLGEVGPGEEPGSEPTVVEADIDRDAGMTATSVDFSLWFEAPNRYRLEVGPRLPLPIAPGTTLVSDGTDVWYYDPASNHYMRSPADGMNAELSLVTLLGPIIPFGGFVSDVAEIVDAYATDPDRDAVLTGEDTLLGRPVYVVEISPAWESGRSGPDGELVHESGGTVRYFLDEEFLFPLRVDQTLGPEGGSFSISFTAIRFNQEIDDDVFRFSPPAGATEVEADGSMGSVGGGRTVGTSGNLGKEVNLPAGFLTPRNLPPGYRTRSIEMTSDELDDRASEVRFLVRDIAGDGYLSVEERRDWGDLPPHLRQGGETRLREGTAWLWKDAGLTHLAWQEDDLVVYMIAQELSVEELLRIAESMEVSNGPGAVQILDDNPAVGFATPEMQQAPPVQR